MKVYTEEQVKTMLNRARIFDGHVGDNFVYILSNVEILSAEIPIELPSDEEIHKQAINYSGFDNEFEAGAKWMRDEIGGGNNEQQ